MSEGNGSTPERAPMAPLSLVAVGTPFHAELGVVGTPDGQAHVLVRFETVSGSWAMPMAPDLARRLGEALISRAEEAAKTQGVIRPIKPGLIIPGDTP